MKEKILVELSKLNNSIEKITSGYFIQEAITNNADPYYIPREHIPYPVFKYYENKENLSFLSQIKILQRELQHYIPKRDEIAYYPEQNYYKYFYLLLTHYYLNNKREFNLNSIKISETNYNSVYNTLIKQMWYELNELYNILIIVADTYQKNNNLYILKNIYRKININMVVEHVNIQEILNKLQYYDQVFFIGHGGKEYFTLAGKQLTEAHFAEAFRNGQNIPKVLGIFSCNKLISDQSILKKIDNYITDDDTSVPTYAEMFLYGYLRSYRKKHIIRDAFLSGKIVINFRSSIQSLFSLYENGVEYKA